MFYTIYDCIVPWIVKFISQCNNINTEFRAELQERELGLEEWCCLYEAHFWSLLGQHFLSFVNACDMNSWNIMYTSSLSSPLPIFETALGAKEWDHSTTFTLRIQQVLVSNKAVWQSWMSNQIHPQPQELSHWSRRELILGNHSCQRVHSQERNRFSCWIWKYRAPRGLLLKTWSQVHSPSKRISGRGGAYHQNIATGIQVYWRAAT